MPESGGQGSGRAFERKGARRVWRDNRIAGAGQAEGVLRKRDVRGRAAACWAQMHGITMLTMEGLFQLEKVGPDPLDAALVTLLEGLENQAVNS